MQSENSSFNVSPLTSDEPLGFASPSIALGKILLGYSGQFAMMSDTGRSGHGDNDDFEELNAASFLADPKTIEMLAALGYRYIVTEQRHEFQVLIDKVASGEITPEHFVQSKQDMYRALGEPSGSAERNMEIGRLAQTASSRQIKILAVDTRSPDLKTHSQSVSRLYEAEQKFMDIGAEERNQESWQQVEDEVLERHKENLAFYYQNIIELRDGQRLRRIQTSAADFAIAQRYVGLRQERLSGHHAIAESILRATNGEKALVFYGSGHIAFNESLDMFLGNAVKISPYTDEAHFRQLLQIDYMDGHKPSDYAIILESGTVYTREAMDRLVIKTAPRMPTALVPDCKP